MKGFQILIVEDESIIALNLKNVLESMGYSVVDIIDSGEETIKRVNDIIPDCILMDITLSGEINGIDAAIKIKDTAKIPIVFLTSDANAFTMEKAKLAQPYGYLLKPVNWSDLNMTLTSAIKRHKAKEGGI